MKADHLAQDNDVDEISRHLFPDMHGMKEFKPSAIRALLRHLKIKLPKGPLDGLKFCSESNSIVQASVGREVRLLQRLNHLFCAYGQAKKSGHVQPSELREKFKSISVLVSKLQKELNFEVSKELRLANPATTIDYLVWSNLNVASLQCGDNLANVTDALVGLKNLKIWADRVAQNNARNVNKTFDRNSGQVALRSLFGGLCGEWIEVFGRVPKSGTLDPFRKFCNYLFEYQEIDITKEQIRYQVESILGPLAKSRSPENQPDKDI